LEPLRAGEQLRVDCRCSDCHPDRTHGLAHGVKKRRARVLEQMPAIGNSALDAASPYPPPRSRETISISG
jgi:hypothetical protein